MVHGIVKSHSGAISVDSKFGKGTTFSILFPLAEEAAVVEPESADNFPTGNESILLLWQINAPTTLHKQSLDV